MATIDPLEPAALRQVRALERIRLQAIRRNDADAMLGLLDPMFICITDCGDLYDRDRYVRAVRTHQLSYEADLELTETDHRVDGDVVILVGMMHGHARLEADMQVFRNRSMRVWRAREAGWKLLAWQSSRRERSPLALSGTFPA